MEILRTYLLYNELKTNMSPSAKDLTYGKKLLMVELETRISELHN